MAIVSLLVLLLPLVASRDVAIGLNSYGTKIFDENRQAGPAIWRQKENVTIEASDNEIISKVLVIDMRPDKDGDAKIVDGGEKQKNVTIELKSPTVFRGYDFHIEVYAVPEAHSTSTDIQAGTSNNTSMTIRDESISTQSSSISDETSEQPTQEPTSANTIRNSNIDNNNQTNDTEIKNITLDAGDETVIINVNEDTSISTPLFDITSTAFLETTGKNEPDFPLTGMEGDEKRLIRKIGDDLFTSTPNTLTTINQSDGTSEPYSIDNNTETASENESDGNNTGFDLGVKGDSYVTTASDIVTTTLSDESVTISPDKNGKDVSDFDDLLSTDGEESRFARQISAEMVSTTNSDISTTEDGLTTTMSPDSFTDFNNETRNQRKAVYDTINDITVTTSDPKVNMEGDNIPPILQIITKNGAYDNGANESRADFNSTDMNVGEVTTTIPDILSTTLSSTENNENRTEDQFRKARGISEENDTLNPQTNEEHVPNYPVFVDPTMNNPNVDKDYVYIPILAVISKHNYPVFRGVLDNIAMNVAFPGLDPNTDSVVAKDTDVILDGKSDPMNIVSVVAQDTDAILDGKSDPMISLTQKYF